MARAKRQIFLDKFFECNCNATEAARQAGYKHPNQQGPRLKKELQAEIDARLDEMAMPANEVLARLGDQAGASIADFITDAGLIDWTAVKEKGHLIKRIVFNKGRKATIELYSAQAALMHLDKEHGGEDGKPLEQRLVIEMRGNVSPDDL